MSEDEPWSPPPPLSRIPYFRDVPIETFPAEAWEVTGPTARGTWRLRLRPGYLPPSLEATVALDDDGFVTTTELTTDRLAVWERRWAETARRDAAAAEALRAARAERMAVGGLQAMPPKSGQVGRATRNCRRVVAAYTKLEREGLFGKRDLHPTQLQVAKEIGVALSTLKRWRKECGLAWPPALDP